MAAQPSSAGSAYSFVSYPAEYAFSPGAAGSYPSPPHPTVPQMDLGANAHWTSPHPFAAFAHLASYPAPPSPMLAHVMPQPGGSPIVHPANSSPPSPPDRSSAETKVLRQLCSAITKMQNTMKDLAERQEQILDRMSLLEQRVGRADDSIERIIENAEAALEDSKSIRRRVEDSESQDAFETRLTDLMDDVVEKLISGIGEEIKDIKKLVKDTERDTLWRQKRAQDADLLGEEPQKELPEL